MRILLVGGLSVNPERFLPLVRNHEIYGIWESTPKWSASLRAGGPYVEIPRLSLESISSKNIQIIWALISPWDGSRTILSLKSYFPELPIIRMLQGGLTPWWHQGSKGNYDFLEFKKATELCDGFMFNALEYRACAIDQGIDISSKPYILTNGMAYNADLIDKETPTKLSSLDGEPHVTLIGREYHKSALFLKNQIHLHYHSAHGSLGKSSRYAHSEQFLGDLSFLHKKPISLTKIFEFKKDSWYSTFYRYDAGIMQLVGHRNIDVYNGIDINVPGRINTYILSGLPPIIRNVDSAILSFLKRYSNKEYFIAFKDEADLVMKLKDQEYLKILQRNLLEIREQFSMQYELNNKIIPFFKTFLKEN